MVLGDAGVIGGAAEGYEILDRQGFTTSSFKQRIDFQRAIEGELAQTITAMDAVSSATVHLAIPEESVFSDNDGMTRGVGRRQRGARPGHGRVDREHRRLRGPRPRPGQRHRGGHLRTHLSSSLDGSGMVSDQQLGMQQLLESQLEMDARDHARPDPRLGCSGRARVGGHELRRGRVRDGHLHHRRTGAAPPGALERGLHRRRRGAGGVRSA